MVPRSLIFNWQQEAARFTPRLRVLTHTGSERIKGHAHFKDYDLILTTYGTLRRDVIHFDDVEFDFVILDEAHYLADEDRGHVWEEAIILTPPRIRMLLLSATVGRADEFAKWIEEVRGTKVRVIDRAGSRPVELRAAYLSSSLQLYPLFDEEGNFNREIERLSPPKRTQQRNFRRR